YVRLPISFEVNRGQTDRGVKFLARGPGYTLFLTPHETVLALHGPAPAGDDRTSLSPSPVLRLKLLGANPAVAVRGEDALPGKSNYFLGQDPRRWLTHLPTYARVRYPNVYPGVDLVYYGHQGQLEWDFVVAPGADPGRIALGLEGVERRWVDAEGDLVLGVGGSEVRWRRPRVYQQAEGVRQEINAGYVLRAAHRVGFRLGEYDRRRPLIIDPVLSYSTYLGGTGGDVAYGIAVDSSGNAYVTGTTGSPNFPTRLAEQDTYSGGGDAFVAKFNAAGSGLVYSTYLGGFYSDTSVAIALDPAGDAYVTGRTYSADFPTTTDALQSSYGGNGDAFVAKLSPTGSELAYSTYLGGSEADFGQAIAVDSAGDAYVTGPTQSTDFPTASPLQIGNDGGSDVFLAKVNPSGTGLVYSTYLGGSSADSAQAIALDSSGNVYLAGYTFSVDFPTQSAVQSSNAGAGDAFVAELNSAASALIFSTYLGGRGLDRAFGLALDTSGNIYITGDSQSADFPTTSGAYQHCRRRFEKRLNHRLHDVE
ncbi:MAG: SBBP repeat-containing protein, partial [Acidobacteriia bacterium]|nr:SBBP repeat-containing protein [Terriglobia bacterium]